MSMSEQSRNWTNALFCAGFALLLGHELDAVARAEWNLLPILSGLAQPAAERAFVLLHVPLFALLLWSSFHRSENLRRRTRQGLCGFLVVHGGLHAALSGHPLYAFTAPVETLTVYGAALVGALYLLAERRDRVRA